MQSSSVPFSGLRAFSPSVYNALPAVYDADEALAAQAERAAFFQEVGDLICGHELDAFVGVSLLHKHNTVDDGQVMVEHYDESRYGRPALVMQRVAWDERPDRVPVVMKVGDDGASLLPIEHSSIAPARDAYGRLDEKLAVFAPAFCDVVRKYRFEELIALCIRRESVIPLADGEELLERSDVARVANVTTATTIAPGVRNVTTTWWFVPSEGGSETRKCNWCREGQKCPPKEGGYDNHAGYSEKTHEAITH
ncbi:MAG TPA: hypothetical protein VHK90_04415 [Thermoanaerobaculia bacterium]|nr:hypothetical protein [Thermoanaerobaculia bacterium]